MRSGVTGTLAAAQDDVSRIPYIRLPFVRYDAGDTKTYDTGDNRVLSIEHHEEAYNDWATIILFNGDGAVPDLRGWSVEIQYGDNTGSEEYIGDGSNGGSEATPRLWVKHHRTVSSEGVKLDILDLEGMWSRLHENYYLPAAGPAPYYTTEIAGDTLTTQGLVDILLTAAGFSLDSVEDDGIINSAILAFWVNQRPYETYAYLLARLMSRTYCYLKAKASLKFDIVWNNFEDALNLTLYSDQAPYFYEYMERKNVIVPNRILCLGRPGTDMQWTDIITEIVTLDGSDGGTDHVTLYGGNCTHLFPCPEIDTESDLAIRADIIKEKTRAEHLVGRLIMPHDCRLELHDKVKILDSRSS